MPRVEIFVGRKKLGFIRITDPVTLIGRGEDCKIVLDNPLVSRMHARLVFRNGQFSVIDMQSANGVFINGEKKEYSLLKDGDWIEIGKHSLKFAFPKEEKELIAQEGFGTKSAEAKMMDSEVDKLIMNKAMEQAVAPSPDAKKRTLQISQEEMEAVREKTKISLSAHLAMGSGSDIWQVPLDPAHPITIGYGKDCDIVLEGTLPFGKCAQVSNIGGKYTIKALSVWRGIKINNNAIRQATLKDGDEIFVSGTKIKFFDKVTR
jgi:pSer/pThr/pTyr-binding forkhead associated (FHA) protein